MSSTPEYCDAQLQAARRHVAELRGFYVHATIYCLVIGSLFLLKLATGHSWWFFWPALGWGLGLAFHAFGVFGKDLAFGRDWEERKVGEYLDRQPQR